MVQNASSQLGTLWDNHVAQDSQSFRVGIRGLLRSEPLVHGHHIAWIEGFLKKHGHRLQFQVLRAICKLDSVHMVGYSIKIIIGPVLEKSHTISNRKKEGSASLRLQ